MVLFDINSAQTIDVEKIEAIVMEMNFDTKEIKAVIGGNSYYISPEKHEEFFQIIQRIEKGSSLSKQYVSV